MTHACGPWHTIEHIGHRYELEKIICDTKEYLIITNDNQFVVYDGFLLLRTFNRQSSDAPHYPRHVAEIILPSLP
jgi:hypothetical protein